MRGDRQAQAAQKLRDSGFQVSIHTGATASTRSLVGTVARQNPPSGLDLAPGKTVSITIATKAPPPPPKPPTTTTTSATTTTPPKPPPLSPKQVAQQKTISCLRGIPLLTVKPGSLGIEVYASVNEGGGNAEIAVFGTPEAAQRYASRGGNAAEVGTLAVALTYKGSPSFQEAVSGCLA